MGKAILSGVVGYIVMTIFLVISFSVAYMVLGEEGSYHEPDSWHVSTTWVIMSFVTGMVGAILGGFLCASIAKKESKAPIVLAAIVFLLHVYAAAVPLLAEKSTEPRPAEVSMADAANKSQLPLIAHILNPIIGGVGVIIGAGLRKK